MGPMGMGAMGMGFGDPTMMHLRNQHLQNELQNRDIDRKASMSFGQSFGNYYPSVSSMGVGGGVGVTGHSNAHVNNMDHSPALLP